jgi:CRP-like cAMP-binding protein
MASQQMTTHPMQIVDLFAMLDRDALDALAAASRIRTIPTGQILCWEGDPGEELLILEGGRVKVCRFTPNGQEVVLAEVSAPVAFGELALIEGSPRTATLVAEREVRIRYLPRTALMELLTSDPRVAMALMQSMARMIRQTNERLADVLTLDVPGRVAKWLLARARATGTVSLDQSQESLARHLGTTRATLSRTLGRFERLGLISRQAATIAIADAPALEVLAKG